VRSNVAVFASIQRQEMIMSNVEFGDTVSIDVTVRGTTRKFQLRDISKADFDALYGPVEAAKGDAKKETVANRKLMLDVLSKVVLREDGSEITQEQAGQMSVLLVNKLAAKAFAFISGDDVETAGEKSVDSESDEKKD
jgi:hypothetical protein